MPSNVNKTAPTTIFEKQLGFFFAYPFVNTHNSKAQILKKPPPSIPNWLQIRNGEVVHHSAQKAGFQSSSETITTD